MTANSFPELAQEVANIIRDHEALEWQVTKSEYELKAYKKAITILATENDLTHDYLKLVLFKAKEELQDEKL